LGKEQRAQAPGKGTRETKGPKPPEGWEKGNQPKGGFWGTRGGKLGFSQGAQKFGGWNREKETKAKKPSVGSPGNPEWRTQGPKGRNPFSRMGPKYFPRLVGKRPKPKAQRGFGARKPHKPAFPPKFPGPNQRTNYLTN